jgi:hypothetical protein
MFTPRFFLSTPSTRAEYLSGQHVNLTTSLAHSATSPFSELVSPRFRYSSDSKDSLGQPSGSTTSLAHVEIY